MVSWSCMYFMTLTWTDTRNLKCDMAQKFSNFLAFLSVFVDFGGGKMSDDFSRRGMIKVKTLKC